MQEQLRTWTANDPEMESPSNWWERHWSDYKKPNDSRFIIGYYGGSNSWFEGAVLNDGYFYTNNCNYDWIGYPEHTLVDLTKYTYGNRDLVWMGSCKECSKKAKIQKLVRRLMLEEGWVLSRIISSGARFIVPDNCVLSEARRCERDWKIKSSYIDLSSDFYKKEREAILKGIRDQLPIKEIFCVRKIKEFENLTTYHVGYTFFKKNSVGVNLEYECWSVSSVPHSSH